MPANPITQNPENDPYKTLLEDMTKAMNQIYHSYGKEAYIAPCCPKCTKPLQYTNQGYRATCNCYKVNKG